MTRATAAPAPASQHPARRRPLCDSSPPAQGPGQIAARTSGHLSQQLGNVAYLRGRPEEAADWYARSLAIYEELGDRLKMAVTYSQLGLLAEEQHNPGQALEWTIRCVALFDDVPHPGSGTGPGQLARLTHQLGIQALEACWQEVTGGPLPGAVRDYVHSHRPDPGDTPEGADR